MVRSYKKDLVWAVSFSMFVILLSWIYSIYHGRPRIVLCNVGQGNGVYIRSPSGKNIIIDTGPPTNAMLICLGREMPFLEKRIDAVILSHLQSDHVGGFAEIIRRYDVQNIYVPVDVLPEKLKKTITNSYTRIITVRQHSLIRTGDGEQIEVLWPPVYPSRIKPSLDMNLFSLVVNVCVFDRCALFPGDTPAQTLTESVSLPHHISLLMVSHHGAVDGTSVKLLHQTHPEVAVISVGKNNYGHPSPKVIELLDTLKIPYKRTDVDGDITILL